MQKSITINNTIKKFNKKIIIDGDKSLSIRFALMASQAIGKSRVYITNSLRLLRLPKKILNFIVEKKLSSGHARLLIGREDALDLAKLIISKQLSVRQLEQLIGKKVSKNTTTKIEDLEVDSLSKKLSNALGLKVKIAYEANTKKSKISIFCNNLDQLNDLIEKLEK